MPDPGLANAAMRQINIVFHPIDLNFAVTQTAGVVLSSGKVSLATGADVQGDICCSGLYIEDGARFMGRVAMG